MPKILELEGYQYFMQPEPRENLGPVRLEDDEVFGRRVKTRMARIGMVRNATRRTEVKVYLEPFPHIRVASAKDLQGWYKGANEKASVRPRPCYTESLLTEPYGGYCPVGCAACYINSGVRGYRGTGLVTVPLNYGEQIRQQLRKINRGAAGYFTSFHDPFNLLEEVYHNTQEAAEAFVEVGLPGFFLSRLAYPSWAIALLKQSPFSYAQKSINTSDSADWKVLSPGALPLEEQYAEIAKLRKAGIYVSIQVNPIIPGVITHEHIRELFRRLGEAGANHVIVKFVEAAYSWAPAMVEKMVKRFGERGKSFEKLFTQNIGGQRAVDEDYRMKGHRLYGRYARWAGMTYSVCYEYEYQRNEAGEIVNKTGISLGPKVTTAAQCHGPRVPVFTRKSPDEMFRPVKDCPPSGCLYCAEGNKGKPRCGDTLAGEARALRLADLKQPIRREL